MLTQQLLPPGPCPAGRVGAGALQALPNHAHNNLQRQALFLSTFSKQGNEHPERERHLPMVTWNYGRSQI